MAYVEPPVIWARTKGDEGYFSTEEPKLDADGVRKLEAAREYMDEESFEKSMERLRASTETGEPVDMSFDAASTITARYHHIHPMDTELMGARQVAAVRLLDMPWPKVTDADKSPGGKPLYTDDLDKHLALVRASVKAPWKTLRGWCDEIGDDNKRTGNLYVKSKDVLERLDRLVKETSAENERKKAEAAARKAERKAAGS